MDLYNMMNKIKLLPLRNSGTILKMINLIILLLKICILAIKSKITKQILLNYLQIIVSLFRLFFFPNYDLKIDCNNKFENLKIEGLILGKF